MVTTKKIKGETWFYCINDQMESQLYNHYTASLKSNTDALPISKQGKQVLKLSLSYFLLDNNEVVVLSTFKTNQFNLIQPDLTSMALKVNAPPPRLV